jgi:hypothetical protein
MPERFFLTASSRCSLRGIALLAITLLVAGDAAAQFNTVFVTSTLHTGNLGGLAGADSICQARANAAGLTGTYRAWLSSTLSSAISRMGSARGFVRRDGAAIADSLSSLTTENALLNAINLTESNAVVGSEGVWTGTVSGGTFSGLGCSDWISTTGSGTVGASFGGPGMWTNFGASGCATPRHLICFQIDLTAPLTVPPPTGRLIFLYSGTFAISPGGLAAADAACAADASDAGLPGNFIALMATSSATAVSRLDNASVNYQRRDGITVGTKAQLGGTAGVQSGIWQLADGTYPSTSNVAVWTGSIAPNVAGTLPSTCSNWSSTSGDATIGSAGLVDTEWWNTGQAPCNANYPRPYCVQTDTPSARRRRAVLTGD